MGSLKYNDLSSTKAIKYNGDYVAEVKYNGTTIWPHYWDGTFTDTSWISTLTTSGTTYTYHITTPEQFANAMYSLQNTTAIPALATNYNIIVFSIEADLYFNRDWKNNFDWEGSTAITNGVKNFLKSYTDVPKILNLVEFKINGNYHKIVGYYGYIPTPGSTDVHISCFLTNNNFPNSFSSTKNVQIDSLNWVNCTFCVEKQGTVGFWLGGSYTNTSVARWLHYSHLTYQHCKFEQMRTWVWSGLALVNSEDGLSINMDCNYWDVLFNNCQYKVADGGTYKWQGCLFTEISGSSSTLTSKCVLRTLSANTFNNIQLTKGKFSHFSPMYAGSIQDANIDTTNRVGQYYYNCPACNDFMPTPSTSVENLISDHNNASAPTGLPDRTGLPLSYFPDESIYNIEMTDTNPL